MDGQLNNLAIQFIFCSFLLTACSNSNQSDISALSSDKYSGTHKADNTHFNSDNDLTQLEVNRILHALDTFKVQHGPHGKHKKEILAGESSKLEKLYDERPKSNTLSNEEIINIKLITREIIQSNNTTMSDIIIMSRLSKLTNDKITALTFGAYVFKMISIFVSQPEVEYSTFFELIQQLPRNYVTETDKYSLKIILFDENGVSLGSYKLVQHLQAIKPIREFSESEWTELLSNELLKCTRTDEQNQNIQLRKIKIEIERRRAEDIIKKGIEGTMERRGKK